MSNLFKEPQCTRPSFFDSNHELELEDPAALLSDELLNTLFVFAPMVVMAPTQTTMIRASMTAYSTAVGPSSAFANVTRGPYHLHMQIPFLSGRGG